jgi:hypothetical protein
MTAGATFLGVFVTVGVVDDIGGHVFGHFCDLACRGITKKQCLDMVKARFWAVGCR